MEQRLPTTVSPTPHLEVFHSSFREKIADLLRSRPSLPFPPRVSLKRFQDARIVRSPISVAHIWKLRRGGLLRKGEFGTEISNTSQSRLGGRVDFRVDARTELSSRAPSSCFLQIRRVSGASINKDDGTSRSSKFLLYTRLPSSPASLLVASSSSTTPTSISRKSSEVL